MILGLAGLAAGLLALASPAAAQLSLGASVMSDYRLRGYSLSRGRPAASARVGYDDPSGIFLDGSASVFLASGDSLQWMGAVGAIGYARRMAGGLSIDAGVLRMQLSSRSSLGREGGYTEIFAGVTGRALSARLAYSPDYFRPGISTLYGSLEAVARPAEDWRLFGHVGALARLRGTPAFPVNPTQYDWRGGVSRNIGKLDLELSISGGGPNRDYYGSRPHDKTAVVGAARMSF